MKCVCFFFFKYFIDYNNGKLNIRKLIELVNSNYLNTIEINIIVFKMRENAFIMGHKTAWYMYNAYLLKVYSW